MFSFKLCSISEAFLVQTKQLFLRNSSSKWTQKLEAATSKMSNNYSTPKDSPQKLSVQQEESDGSKYHIRHNYIPMTRKSLAKRIMEEETLISPEDHTRFHEFAVALDHSVGRLYHGVLGELKVDWKVCSRRTPPPLPQTPTAHIGFGHFNLGLLGYVQEIIKSGLPISHMHFLNL
jgi:hypothetical protein